MGSDSFGHQLIWTTNVSFRQICPITDRGALTTSQSNTALQTRVASPPPGVASPPTHWPGPRNYSLSFVSRTKQHTPLQFSVNCFTLRRPTSNYLQASTIVRNKQSVVSKMPSQRRGRFTACILGHSFVRRLHDPIACEDHDVAHCAPDSLRVVRLFSRIDIFGRSGYTVSELRHEVLAAGQQRPDLVIINCGSNDLCQERCDVEQVARGLMSYTD